MPAAQPRAAWVGGGASACRWLPSWPPRTLEAVRLFLTVLLAACSAAPPAEPPPPAKSAGSVWRYTVAVDAGLAEMLVRACFPGGRPRLVAVDDDAREHLTWSGAPVDARGMHLRDECVDYRVDLRSASGAGDLRMGRLLAPDRLASPDSWLWYPAGPVPRDLDAQVRIELPPGAEVSTPWPRIDARTWRIPWSTFYFPIRMLFGKRFHKRELQIPGGVLRVAQIGDFDSGPQSPAGLGSAQALVDEALIQAATEVGTIFGGPFPRPAAQIIVVVQPGRKVGFGMATRGGGPCVILFVGRRVDPAHLKRDWTFVHELSHLALPHTGGGNAWLGEGLASYYQQILRARGGRLSEAEAWSRLHDGFVRGSGDGTGRPLGEESRMMGRTGAYWRVYWGGAAWALRTDLRLRRAGKSLDGLIRHWRACCGDGGPVYTATGLLKEADRWSGLPIRAETEALLAGRGFPDYGAAYGALGIEAVDAERVRLEANALRAHITGSGRSRGRNSAPRRPPRGAAPSR